jgi:hypothetical protein
VALHDAKLVRRCHSSLACCHRPHRAGDLAADAICGLRGLRGFRARRTEHASRIWRARCVGLLQPQRIRAIRVILKSADTGAIRLQPCTVGLLTTAGSVRHARYRRQHRYAVPAGTCLLHEQKAPSTFSACVGCLFAVHSFQPTFISFAKNPRSANCRAVLADRCQS